MRSQGKKKEKEGEGKKREHSPSTFTPFFVALLPFCRAFVDTRRNRHSLLLSGFAHLRSRPSKAGAKQQNTSVWRAHKENHIKAIHRIDVLSPEHRFSRPLKFRLYDPILSRTTSTRLNTTSACTAQVSFEGDRNGGRACGRRSEKREDANNESRRRRALLFLRSSLQSPAPCLSLDSPAHC